MGKKRTEHRQLKATRRDATTDYYEMGETYEPSVRSILQEKHVSSPIGLPPNNLANNLLPTLNIRVPIKDRRSLELSQLPR